VNQSIIMKRLTKLGYDVVCCENGIECVSLFEKTPAEFDIILMDVQV
jgi:CheY-like chemotaxis protein